MEIPPPVEYKITSKLISMGIKVARNLAASSAAASKTASLLGAIVAGVVLLCGQAKADVLASRYAVSLSGVRIGEAIVRMTLDAKTYKVTISADVGPLLNNTRVEGESSGARAGVKLTPAHYRLVTSDGQDSSIDFKAQAAKGDKMNPILRGVLDPLSALLGASLRPAWAPGAPCDHVLPVFMSRNRLAVSLSPVTGGEEGRDPHIITCQVRFAVTATAGGANPVAIENVQWEIGFQKLVKPNFWLVETISLPSDMGTVTIERVETAISGS
jgi:hypothetical protein